MAVTDRAIAGGSVGRLSNPTGWDEMRCFNCRRLLMRLEAFALRVDHRLEVKCPKCNCMNYQIGQTT